MTLTQYKEAGYKVVLNFLREFRDGSLHIDKLPCIDEKYAINWVDSVNSEHNQEYLDYKVIKYTVVEI